MNKMVRTWSRDYVRKLKRREDGQLMELCGGIRGCGQHMLYMLY